MGTTLSVRDPRGLSRAEQVVVREVCAGRNNDEIARRLGKGLGTVKNQLSSVFRKLGVDSRARLIARLGGRAEFGGRGR